MVEDRVDDKDRQTEVMVTPSSDFEEMEDEIPTTEEDVSDLDSEVITEEMAEELEAVKES